MSNWQNEAGEPYMTAAELRFEAELDDMAAYERAMDPDAFYGDYEPDVDPSTCKHEDVSYGVWVDGPFAECDLCGTETTNVRFVTDEYGIGWHEVVAW
jgi:hypothetical protein